jgi:hypothetical protein
VSRLCAILPDQDAYSLSGARQLCSIPNFDCHLFAEGREGRLDLFRFGGMAGVEHPADNLFMNAQSPGHLRIAEALVTDGQIQGKFWREPKGYRDHAFALFSSGGRGDILMAGQTDREVGAERIHGFLHRFTLVVAIGSNSWEVRKFHQDTAIAAGGEFSWICKYVPRQLSHPTLELRTIHGTIIGQLCPSVKNTHSQSAVKIMVSTGCKGTSSRCGGKRSLRSLLLAQRHHRIYAHRSQRWKQSLPATIFSRRS